MNKSTLVFKDGSIRVFWKTVFIQLQSDVSIVIVNLEEDTDGAERREYRKFPLVTVASFDMEYQD